MSVQAGIIGFGYMGEFHLRKCQEMGVNVAAVYDVAAEKLEKARKEGLETYERLEDFLKDEHIRLVFICTPNHVHAELAIAALNAGKHVMCEKPVTMNSEELEQVIRAAEANDRIFTAHMNRRWDVDYLVVKEVIESGEIGNVTTINSRVAGQRGVCFGWRADPVQGGGMLYDWGIHLIDQFLCMFAGRKVISIYARLQSILTPAVDDSFELQMQFDNGTLAVVNVCTFCLQPSPRWFVHGDRGTLKLDDFSGEKGGVARIRENVPGFDSVFGKHNIGPSRTMAPLHPDYLEKLEIPKIETDPLECHRNLFEAAEGKEPVYVTVDQIRRSMKIIDLAFESSKQNQVIPCEI